METMTGACKYCGQINAFEWVGPAVPDQEALDKEGTRVCSCEMARIERDREYKINAAVECIERILPNPEEKAAKTLLTLHVTDIVKGDINQIAINIGNGTKVKMQMTGESIKVNRTDTSSRQETV